MASTEPLLSLAEDSMGVLSDICELLKGLLTDLASETVWEGFERSLPGQETSAESQASGKTRVWVLADDFSAWTEDEKGEKRLYKSQPTRPDVSETPEEWAQVIAELESLRTWSKENNLIADPKIEDHLKMMAEEAAQEGMAKECAETSKSETQRNSE